MAGLIKREDIDEVRSRTRIDEVVGEHVTLRNAGVGSMKGLCPFHDERSPSFHVRPQVGMYHCFGCGESGDVFTFLQKMDGVTFAESVERLAERAGVQLTYAEGTSGPDREEVGRRQRLIEAHQVAEDFFRSQLGSPEAAQAREYLHGRAFDDAALARFGVGYAPRGWDGLLKALRSRGFTTEELTASGLVSEGQRGVYDRFRGRIMWPIRDVTGRTIGFGARKLYDDDPGPKYLNTPETQLYRKSQVLYGLDLAKRAISKTKRAVIVEGYTDVMAAHLAGAEQAVATCGTAFGEDHVRIIQRLLGDESDGPSEVIFTFDGDEAGQKAALRAFDLDAGFLARTTVAVERTGRDPSDLRLQEGDAAVVELIDSRTPLVEFALRAAIEKFDLGAVEGRVGAVRAAAPVLAGIRDVTARPMYERMVADFTGTDADTVAAEVRRARSAPRRDRSRSESRSGALENGSDRRSGQQAPEAAPPDPAAVRIERGALQVALQQPQFVNAALFDALTGAVFTHPGLRRVHALMQAAGGVVAGLRDPASWPEKVLTAAREAGDSEGLSLIGGLAVEPLPAASTDEVERYSRAIIARLFDADMRRITGELHARLQRTDPSDGETSGALLQQLHVLEVQRARLRQMM